MLITHALHTYLSLDNYLVLYLFLLKEADINYIYKRYLLQELEVRKADLQYTKLKIRKLELEIKKMEKEVSRKINL